MKSLIEKTYTHKSYRIALHLLFWLLMLASYYYFNTISFNPARGTPATYLLAIHNAVTYAAAFYPLMYFIWPRYLSRKKWGKGVLLLLLWVVVIASLNSLGDWLIFNRCQSCGERLALYSPDYYNFLQRNFPNIVFIRVLTGGFAYMLIIQISLPVAIKIGRNYYRQTVQQLQLAKDNLQLEFNFLKAQVNPHFLFNTLNNLYALVMADRKEGAAATISRLSGFMRYTLYETGGDTMPLEKEVSMLKDYIELEKLRLNKTEVLFHYEIDRNDYTIPPLLFMPAVENAFKYVVDKEGSQLQIRIQAVNKQLALTVQNNFDPGRISTTGGIGLQNLQRRLQHYYGGKGSYQASQTNDVYLFRLSCPLS